MTSRTFNGIAACLAALTLISTAPETLQGAGQEAGLLFYLSADRGLTADVAAGGDPAPNFASDVRVIADGARGPGLEAGHTQLLSYHAPGNIYATRGTLSFFWRSREPVGPTAFPIFRVGYADHSSWDMAWLRIDYNGKPGFDAFVTDASLSRLRVSYPVPSFPDPKHWTHLALSWDEAQGIRFYVDGRLAGRVDQPATLFAALDQFGPHSRTIGPMQVQSAYNFVRGGDLDELRIYDRMLADEQIAALARGVALDIAADVIRDPASPAVRDEWWHRYGWNRADAPPPALSTRDVRIRKVEIHDAYDLKRWWWKATDGIRETTWPGVYNRSRLPGRNDYFQLPDWDCYSTSGKSVTFTLPDEPWNQVEISGAAWGRVEVVDNNPWEPQGSSSALFDRPRGQERTVNRLAEPIRGRKIRFTNVEQEQPIGELSVFSVTAGREPAGIATLAYTVSAAAAAEYPTTHSLLEFIRGRFEPAERRTVVALPAGAPRESRAVEPPAMPIVHVVIPGDFRDVNFGARRTDFSYTWTNIAGGLDGIAIDLPGLDLPPTHGGLIPINIQVKDPIWPLRNLIDVSVSVAPREPHTLWLDTRDRMLPNATGLFLSIAAAAPGFGPASLDGTRIRLVFKPWKDAAPEHTLDRFTQVRDNYANLLEEHTNTRRLSLYSRLEADMTDLLRVDPNHELGRLYWYDNNKEQPRPPVKLSPPVPGVPLWASRQVELLGSISNLVNWYIDHRQIDNGEFGGGLSDDGDLTNVWPGTAFMGADPEKIRASLLREMDAFYANGMFTNGLSTIQTDELHSYEEGIQALGQSLLLDYGSPKQLERAMQTASATEHITGVNAAGHRHIRSSYFSGTVVAEEGVWGWSKPSSYLMLQPSLALVDYNGSPRVKKWLLELADGLLAHRTTGANGAAVWPTAIEFATDKGITAPSAERTWPLLWAAFRWTGDRKYLQPFLDAGPRSLRDLGANALDQMGMRDRWKASILSAAGGVGADEATKHLAWQVSGDTSYLESLYTGQVETSALRDYINTEGSPWIDRVTVVDAEVQRARLGGIALVRNQIVPGHAVSWRFDKAGDERKVGILIPDATPTHVRIQAFNLDAAPVTAHLTGWDVAPGTWKVTIGNEVRTVPFEKTIELPVTFAPKRDTTIEMELVSKGVPYWSRPDLGVSAGDVVVRDRVVTVTVHSLGAVASAKARVTLSDSGGHVIATADIPPIAAPDDLRPRTAQVKLRVPSPFSPAGATIAITSEGELPEITTRNNRVVIGAPQ